jgi:hypothetical protein
LIGLPACRKGCPPNAVKSITGPKASQKAVEAHGTLSVIAGYPLHRTPPKNWHEPDGIRQSTERKLAIPLQRPGGCEPISLRKSDAFSL